MHAAGILARLIRQYGKPFAPPSGCIGSILSFYLGRFIASLHDVSAVVRYLNAEDAGHCVMDQRLYPSLTELIGQQFPILIRQAFDRSTMLLISQRLLSLLSAPHTEVI